MERNSRPLNEQVQQLLKNPQPARLTATGEMLIGSSARMESGGPLNPAHSRWLQGLPIAWENCADMVTLSPARSRKGSSKRSSKPQATEW